MAHMRLLSTTLALLLLTVHASAATPVATSKFKLQAGPVPGIPGSFWSLKMVAMPPHSLLSSSPDGETLYAVVPEKQHQWRLIRIRNWETGTPTQESLTFQGADIGDNLEYTAESLTFSADGHSLLARLLMTQVKTFRQTAIVVLVDLSAFRIQWRRLSDAALVANSQWIVTQEGLIVAATGPELPPPARSHLLVTLPEATRLIDHLAIGRHQAAVLTFPELQVQAPCNYSVTDGNGPDPADPVDPEGGEDPFAKTVESTGCDAVLKAARLNNAASLLTIHATWARYNVESESCADMDFDRERQLVLWSCPRAGDPNVTHREVRVVPRDAGHEAQRIILPLSSDVRTALCRNGKKAYLAVLSPNLEVNLYRIPD